MNSGKSTRRQKTEDRRQKTEDRRQKTEDRRQKAEACPERSRRDKSLFSVLCPLFSVLCVLLLAGCVKQQRYETIEQICVPDMDKAEVMQIAEDVLAKMHFTIDKADSESGVIITRPLPGAQFFEFWRSDNVGNFNAAEANLHSIRRTAQIDIKPQDNKIFISCDVQVQRLSVPEFEIRNLKFEIPALGGMEWIDLGNDTMLETEILKRIEQRMTSDEGRDTKGR